MSPRYSYGLVLSGGGARGFAHIGVLKALDENGIKPGIISAVSAGSIVGALYADGKSPDRIFEIFASFDLFRLLKVNRPSFGLLKAQGISKTLEKELTVQNLEELKIPLIVSATNFTKAKTEFFSKGSITDAVLASSAIPLVLKPYSINGQMYVDGGLMNNLPVEPLINKCESLIGVNVNPVHEVEKVPSFRNFADRVLHLAIRANVLSNIQRCDIYIEPPGLMQFNLFKVSAADKIYQLGYLHAMKLLSNHQKI